ncbi:hypothetical protein D187_000943 [Cystobacter fuscus DSM 2262]|uniref:Uncharacterized protein n=2 Tax=Cystobacter fuscus TaxID=43 RepID=S9P9V9_CYSF2|nr:hypothetical protein D187_000943 [Cystobacter fuscus DSM 2262]
MDDGQAHAKMHTGEGEVAMKKVQRVEVDGFTVVTVGDSSLHGRAKARAQVKAIAQKAREEERLNRQAKQSSTQEALTSPGAPKEQ